MNILLCNDDGYSAKGINTLMNYLSKEHNVYMVAPDKNRSAVSSMFTMYSQQLYLTPVKKNVWACTGSPTDCVITAFRSNLLDVKIDAVITGINNGANLGRDIVYSGTCAAARQATFYGYPAIAVSVEPYSWKGITADDLKFDAMADFVTKNLEKLISLSSVADPKVFVNVNGYSLDEYKGVKMVDKLCLREYGDGINLEQEKDRIKINFIPAVNTERQDGVNDYSISKEGYITVSRVYSDTVSAGIVDGINFSL